MLEMAVMEEKHTAANVVMKPLRNAWSKPVLLASRAVKQLVRWHQLRRDRIELMRLSDDRLRDIGLSRADVQRESRRPFWHDPLRR
jgi:uncharacterized protein YjiS (DUF1127 family)